MKNKNENIKDNWNRNSDRYYKKYGTEEKINEIINNPKSAFHPETFSLIKDFFPSLNNKKICVPASGDNHAVIAFALLGAQVTSVDISQKQLENAKKNTKEIGLDSEFICEDIMDFKKIKSDEYDLVYTSNGVYTWISNLDVMHQNFYKVLKNKGVYIMFDVHPFMRPFEDNTEKIEIKKPYEAIGPFTEIPRYHWRIQDIVNSIITSGLDLKYMKEFHAEYDTFWHESSGGREGDIDYLYDWRKNKLASFPQWLSISSQKNI